LVLEVLALNAVQIALTVTLASAFLAFLKILVDPTSPYLKRRNIEKIRYSLLSGVGLGLAFAIFGEYSEYLILGVSCVLLSFTLYYYLLRRTTSLFYGLRVHWVSRETARGRFFHFATVTAMASFVMFFFLLQVFVVPQVTAVPLENIAIMLFASAASGLLALTIFVPRMDVLFRLIDDYIQSSHRPAQGTVVELEDTDFPAIIAGTAFTPTETIDAFESLRLDGYAERQPHPILGHVRYRIFSEGVAFLDAGARDVRGRIDAAIHQADIALDNIDSHVNGARALESKDLSEAVTQLQRLGEVMRRLKEEYGRLVPAQWEAGASKRLHELVTGIHEQRVAKPTVDA
jgi:hypothetical protein